MGVELTDEVVQEVEPVLLGFAMRAVRNRDLARDLVQDTFTAAMASPSRFEGRSTLRTWLVGILSRKIVDHYRKTRRELLTDVPPEPDSPSSFAAARPHIPETRLDEQKAMQVIERSLSKLTELERMAVLLVDVEHLDRKEACNAMDIQPTHLRVLLHRGRHKLRKALEDAELRPHRP